MNENMIVESAAIRFDGFKEFYAPILVKLVVFVNFKLSIYHLTKFPYFLIDPLLEWPKGKIAL